jgi:hypothetical protein
VEQHAVILFSRAVQRTFGLLGAKFPHVTKKDDCVDPVQFVPRNGHLVSKTQRSWLPQFVHRKFHGLPHARVVMADLRDYLVNVSCERSILDPLLIVDRPLAARYSRHLFLAFRGLATTPSSRQSWSRVG